jgi:hypothetical protein
MTLRNSGINLYFFPFLKISTVYDFSPFMQSSSDSEDELEDELFVPFFLLEDGLRRRLFCACTRALSPCSRLNPLS